jgi:hypothetical protein
VNKAQSEPASDDTIERAKPIISEYLAPDFVLTLRQLQIMRWVARKRKALAEAYHDDFLEDFYLAVGAELPALGQPSVLYD